MKELTKDELIGIVEHDYHQNAFSKDLFIDTMYDALEKARKWDTLMTHTKYHNTFGCAYHFQSKEENRRNQFLQSENVKLKQDLENIKSKFDFDLDADLKTIESMNLIKQKSLVLLNYKDRLGDGFDALIQLLEDMPTEKELWGRWISLVEEIKKAVDGGLK